MGSGSKLVVGEFMRSHPRVIDRKSSVDEAFEIMCEQGFRHLPVQDHGKLVGVLSDRDIMMAWASDPRDTSAVEDVMSREPYAVSPDTDLDEVVEVMAGNKIGCAVVKDHGEIVGIFTTSDALHAMADMVRRRRSRKALA